MARLLTLKTAWLMDTVGNKDARIEIAAIKVAAPQRGAEGHRPRDPGARRRRASPTTSRSPRMYAHLRTLRLADGPDEVHKLHDRAPRAAGGGGKLVARAGAARPQSLRHDRRRARRRTASRATRAARTRSSQMLRATRRARRATASPSPRSAATASPTASSGSGRRASPEACAARAWSAATASRSGCPTASTGCSRSGARSSPGRSSCRSTPASRTPRRST